MGFIRHIIFKWMIALVYFGVVFSLLLLFPASVSAVLLVVYAAFAFWTLAVADSEYSRAASLRPLTRWDVADFENFRARLKYAAEDAGLRREPYYAIEVDEIPNAYAVGGLRGIVVFTTGSLKLLTPDELMAVAGHELQHLASRDALPAVLGGAWLQLLGWISAVFRRTSDVDASSGSQIIGVIAGVIALALDAALAVVGWLAYVTLAQRSRYDENQADLTGARIVSASVMISALQKVEEKSKEYVRRQRNARWSPAWVSEQLHASHPPTEERIRFLQAAAERGEVRVS
ncbi:MAG TPA: M48 family metallopeptidase [Symbiobacteriaceae bacterium]|jgi:Zn-dependent protease with chaperone function|nr:M48 family metallopeptidase [Symbiobacteriaceae bacterium]